MSNTKTFSLGGQELPIDLQAVLGSDDGKPLSIGNGNVQFDFGFRGVRMAGDLTQTAEQASLKLVGDLGPMPFSGESRAARAGLTRIVEAANDHLGPGYFKVVHGRILMGADHIAVPAPVTATGLITAVARLLLPLQPYMELVGYYVAPPLVPRRAGQSAVRPEWRNSP
jgi:hypothetical protein